MFPFSAGQWDATLSSRCHDDGASLGLPFGRRSGARRRAPFLFTRVITYEFPDQRRAEIEVIVATLGPALLSRVVRVESLPDGPAPGTGPTIEPAG
jgi:hypothetical protein